MKMIVSPSMSLVAAGVASGICFFLLSSMRRGRKLSDAKSGTKELLIDDSRCACCFKPFRVDRGVRCNDCNARSCRKGCSRWDTEENAWHCLFCHQQRCWLRRKEKWFETYGGELEELEFHRFFNTAKSRVYVAGVENAAASSGSSLAAPSQEETHTMETVRDFVEKIVEGLIGSVDDTPIDRLYDHPAYDKLLAQFIVPLAGALTRLAVALQLSLTNKPTTDPPTMAHTALRDIVERAVTEARKLPGLNNSSEARSNEEGRNVAEHSYEDLLATAILNKVIEKFQREQVDGNSNVLHEKLANKAKPSPSESELGLDEGVEEGCSSLEPLSQDECSDSSASCSRQIRNRSEPMSLTIEERIEEVTTTYTSDEEHRENDVLPIRNSHRVPFPELGMDIIDPSQESSEDSQDEPSTSTSHIDMVSPVESWEENWLFQKKKVQKQADPVAMLVPNPSADFKALIGDKDAEDTSDLSECSSAQSDEEIEKELMEAISNVVPRSPKKKEFDAEPEVKALANGFRSIPQISIDEVDAADDLSNSDIETNQKIENPVDWDEKCELGHNKEERTDDLIDSYSVKSNETSETKETELKSEICDAEDETKSVPVETIHKKVDCESKESQLENKAVEVSEKTESECSLPNEEIKEKATESANNNSIIKSVDENSMTEDSVVCDLPKTPFCTPVRASLDDDVFENDNDQGVLDAREEHVLNSLESAKKKLMMDDEDEAGKLVEEEAKESTDQKVYLAEDAQQESEYTEHYDIATQRHLDSLTKIDTNSETYNEDMLESNLPKEPVPISDDGTDVKSTSQSEKQETTEDAQLFTPPRPGTIAEREHKKWENAPPIENNPYSEENIQRRLWQRQYSRRLSDIPGAHTELTKSNGADLEVDLTPNQPDITRFGRDYYINNSKSSSGDRGWRSGSSRPNSSLSQRSSSTTSADHEQQDDSQYRQTDTALNGSSDVKTKVAKWQNNIEANYQSILRRSDSMKAWEEKRVEEMLEHERKNSKNEINAKLNNQENYDSAIIDANKAYSEESQKKIRRIDLKAYGFENEFLGTGKSIRPAPQRVVNKLDLKSFGYDGGLRRSQSNNHLDSTVNESDFKPRLVRTSNKSNLSRNGDYHQINDCHSLTETPDSTDSNLTQSTESLNKLHEENYGFFGVLKSAKSVPNITKCDHYSISNEDPEEEIEGYTLQDSLNQSPAQDYAFEKLNLKNDDTLDGENNRNCLAPEALSPCKETEEIFARQASKRNKLPMPSVRKLAEAFSKQPDLSLNPGAKGSRTNGNGNGRASTPEIQIVETPRQMHSLTARSLSKKFREGLRQIPNKVTSPPASHVTMEQARTPEPQTDIVQSKIDRMLNDTDVISPGKLKSNIIFWEQMQRRS